MMAVVCVYGRKLQMPPAVCSVQLMDGILQTHLHLGPGLDQDWDLGPFLQGAREGPGRRQGSRVP